VKINVFVRSENMAFNGVSDLGMPRSRKSLQSCEMSVPVSCLDLNESVATTLGLCEDYFGERPLSFRSLLKRYVTNSVTAAASSASALPKQVVFTRQILPLNQSPYGTTTIAKQDLFSYLRYAYMGIRGSIRHRVRVNTSYATIFANMTFASLSVPSASNDLGTVAYADGYNYCSLNGTVLFEQALNAGIEFETPFYSPNLFQFCFNVDYSGGANGDTLTHYYRNFQLATEVSQAGISVHSVFVDQASGEDFCLLRMQGVPCYSIG